MITEKILSKVKKKCLSGKKWVTLIDLPWQWVKVKLIIGVIKKFCLREKTACGCMWGFCVCVSVSEREWEGGLFVWMRFYCRIFFGGIK